MDLYKKFQQTVTDDIPALFLYSPNYLYVVNKKVQGINISSLVSPDEKICRCRELVCEDEEGKNREEIRIYLIIIYAKQN